MQIHPINARPQMPRHNESSHLRSPFDSDATARQWRKTGVVSVTVEALALNIRFIQRQLDMLRKKGKGGAETNFDPSVWETGTPEAPVDYEEGKVVIEPGFDSNAGTFFCKVDHSSDNSTIAAQNRPSATPDKWLMLP